MKKNETLQNGFNAFLQKPKAATTETAKTTATATTETFSKHNLHFSDVLFEKVKILQARSGKSQREVLDAIIRQYVDEYERKNGALVAETLEL